MKYFSDTGLGSANAHEREHISSIACSNGKFIQAKFPLRSTGLSPEQSLPNRSLSGNNY